MELNESQQKIIYNFLKATSENLCGFRSLQNKDFIFNKSLSNKLKIQSKIPENTSCIKKEKLTEDNPSVFKNSYIKKESFLTSDELWQLSQVRYDVENCKSCTLYAGKHKYVFGEGPFSFTTEDQPKKRPEIMVIGEGPGHDEDITGRPFVGRAGQLLDKMLIAINLSRTTNCYICNVVKCRPPNNRQPNPDEVKYCLPFLHRQIQILKPNYIMLMGRTACHALLDTSEGINRLHGKFFDFNGIPTMCTYHPSALLHNESLKRPAWEDLKLFKKRISEF